jgi:hypothetical protein
MALAVSSVVGLIGPPVNKALIHRYGGFLEVSIFSGIVCLIGGCIEFVTKAATPQGMMGKVQHDQHLGVSVCQG